MNLVMARQTGRGYWNSDGKAGLRAHPGGIAENIVTALRHLGHRGPDDNEAQGGHLVTHSLSAEGHDASEDGTGRGTPIVFTERTRKEGRTFEAREDQSYALLNPGSGGRTHSRQLYDGLGVRRLTPTECERLQGFPEVENNVIIELCSDHQMSDVPAATSNLRSQESASPAEESAFRSLAQPVDHHSLPHHLDAERLAPADVHIFCGLERIEMSSQGKLLWSAAIAGLRNSCHLPIEIDAFAHRIAGMTSCVDRIIRHGEAGLPLSGRCSIIPKNGRLHVRLYGNETWQPASDAGVNSTIPNAPMKSITSSHSSIETIEHDLIISCCSVVAAISGYIPTQTLAAGSFKIEITIRRGWTCLCADIPCTCPDGPRYRALGNAVTVNVIEWIGTRLRAAMEDPA